MDDIRYKPFLRRENASSTLIMLTCLRPIAMASEYFTIESILLYFMEDASITCFPPSCWWNLNEEISLTSVIFGINMAAISLSFESEGIGCKPAITGLCSILDGCALRGKLRH